MLYILSSGHTFLFFGFKIAQLHCFELFFSVGCSYPWLSPSLRLSLSFCFCQSISQSVSQPLSFYLSLLHRSSVRAGTRIHIARVPLGKLLSLPMNSAMLLLSLDPKGNIMNNEESGERGGWGSGTRRWAAWEREREREALQDQDTVGRWREGNLLVFAHQLGRRGDLERMEGDASWTRGGEEKAVGVYILKSACLGDRLGIRDEEASGEMRVRKWTRRGRGLEDVRGSSAHCLQHHLSSRPSSPCQHNCVSGPQPELAPSFKHALKWMCSVY